MVERIDGFSGVSRDQDLAPGFEEFVESLPIVAQYRRPHAAASNSRPEGQ